MSDPSIGEGRDFLGRATVYIRPHRRVIDTRESFLFLTTYLPSKTGVWRLGEFNSRIPHKAYENGGITVVDLGQLALFTKKSVAS